MFIIVEGPDGVGKSTFIRELSLELWRQARGTVLINPKRSPNQPVLVEYKARLDFYRPRIGLDLILDRCWYSDDVYGPIWRGEGLDPKERRELEDWALKLGACVVLLEVPDDVLVERVLGERLSDDDPSDVEHMTPELIKTYADEYRRQRWSWDLPRLDNPTVRETVAYARVCEEESKMGGRRS